MFKKIHNLSDWVEDKTYLNLFEWVLFLPMAFLVILLIILTIKDAIDSTKTNIFFKCNSTFYYISSYEICGDEIKAIDVNGNSYTFPRNQVIIEVEGE